MESKRWHILRHPNPTLIDDIFSRRKEVSITDDEPEMPLFDYFIPYCEINFRPSLAHAENSDVSDRRYEPMLDGEAFRADLRSYIFVYGEARMIERMLSYSWNRNLKHPLRGQRESNGRLVVVSSTTMDIFRSALRQLDFQICEGQPTVGDVHEGDEVMMIDGPMKGAEGMVSEIRERKGELILTVAFNLFSNTNIMVPGIKLEHVRLRNQEADRLLKDDVITNFETELQKLLYNRHGEHGSVEQNKADRKQLAFLNKYQDIDFLDITSRNKFKALMLICAYLMNDKSLIAQRIQEVAALLHDVTEPEDDVQCYLMTALFIATHDVTLRQRVKNYKQTHPDCPLAIRRFYSVAKRIKIKNVALNKEQPKQRKGSQKSFKDHNI